MAAQGCVLLLLNALKKKEHFMIARLVSSSLNLFCYSRTFRTYFINKIWQSSRKDLKASAY